MSTEIVVWVSVTCTWMSSFFTPGSWATMDISLSCSRISIKGSVSVFISFIRAFEGWRVGSMFPYSLMIGFPSGPVVIEKPKAYGPLLVMRLSLLLEEGDSKAWRIISSIMRSIRSNSSNMSLNHGS